MTKPSDEDDRLSDQMEEQIEQQRHRGIQPHCFGYLALILLVVILILGGLFFWVTKTQSPVATITPLLFSIY